MPPDNLYDRNTIVNKIKEFNDLNNGYQISNDKDLGWNPAELHLAVATVNTLYESTYTSNKLDNEKTTGITYSKLFYKL